MAKKENTGSGEHQPSESPAVDDAKSMRKKAKKDLDSDKVVTANSKSKSSDIQGTSSESGAKDGAPPQTSQTQPAPENPSEIMPSDQPSTEPSEDALQVEAQTQGKQTAQSSTDRDPPGVEESEPEDQKSVSPAQATRNQGEQAVEGTAPAQADTVDDNEPENEEINSNAVEDIERDADKKETAPENTEQREAEANSEKGNSAQGPEAQESDPDAVDKNQASAGEETIPEATPKTNADENGDIHEDVDPPPQPEDQGTGQDEFSADDAVEAQATERAHADDDTSDPSAPDNQETITGDAAAEDDIEDQSSKADSQKKSVLKIAVSAILIVAVFSGFFIFDNKSKLKGAKTNKAQTSENQARPERTQRREIVDIQPSVIPSRYDRQINEISALRDTLLKKQAEVQALKQSYRSGIEELEKEIFDELRQTDVETFIQATENKRILFRLKTIQRRRAYIRQLEVPYAWVSKACEQLLYLKRRVIMDLQVSEVASGIDMNRHARQMQAALQKYQPTAEKLAVDPTHAQLEALETIWRRIQSKKSHDSAGQSQSRNQIISEQICTGNFNRLSELSEISVETARCLIELKASDLFLNRLTEISPGSARQLCQWKGDWMCLNGIKALSPRVAHFLFQWDGTWISLNGLTEFPTEIGEMLLNWEGKQLELMGLQFDGDADATIALEYLARWEQSGGKLFVPQNLRNKLDALHRQPG